MNVAVIGLGIMGGAMARHLAAAGVLVSGYDPAPAARDAAAAAGVRSCETAAEAVAGAQLAILSLPSLGAVKATLASLAAHPTPLVIADTSTLELADKLALPQLAGSHQLLDCPVSGTGAQMAARDAVIYASGARAALDVALPVFAHMARASFDLGAYGNGTRMKLVANHLVAIHNVATAEAMLLGMKAGIQADTMMAAIAAGAGNSRIFELRAPLIAADRYEPATMKLSVWAKDMAAIAAFARETGTATPLFDTVAPLYEAALTEQGGDLDTAAVARALGARRTSSTGE